MTPITKCC